MRGTVKKLRDRASATAVALRGIARRLTVAMTSAAGFWQLLGYQNPDGTHETFDDVEAFQQVGFRSRPKKKSRAEVIVVNVGGENGHPIVIATRDKSIEIALDEDETAIFNGTGKLVKITKDGKVELGAAGLVSADGLVHGTGIDPWTGATYHALGNTSAIVRGKK